MIFSFTAENNNHNQYTAEVTKERTIETEELEVENFSLDDDHENQGQQEENETIDFHQPTIEQEIEAVQAQNKFDSITSNISAQSRQSRIRMNKMKNIKQEISSLINKMDQSQREKKDEQNEEIQEYNEPAEKEVVSSVVNNMTNYDVTTTNRTQQTSGHAMYEVMKKLAENQYNVNSDPNILSEP